MNHAITQTFSNHSLYAITVDDYIEPADERKIRAVFETMQTAWDDNNEAVFSACFTEYSDYVTFRGDHYTAKENNIAKHVQFNNTRLYINIKSIRFLNDEMAIVHTENAMLQQYETAKGSCKLSYNTNILIKENSVWKVTSFHNSKKVKMGISERIIKWLMGSRR